MAGRVSKTADGKYKDNYTGQIMTKSQFALAIQAGQYPKYYVKHISGVLTPVSRPDKTKNNNLN